MAKEYGEFGVGLRDLLVVMGIKWNFLPSDKTENLGLLNSSWHVPKIKIIIVAYRLRYICLTLQYVACCKSMMDLNDRLPDKTEGIGYAESGRLALMKMFSKLSCIYIGHLNILHNWKS